jgi:hypothetical protein
MCLPLSYTFTGLVVFFCPKKAGIGLSDPIPAAL